MGGNVEHPERSTIPDKQGAKRIESAGGGRMNLSRPPYGMCASLETEGLFPLHKKRHHVLPTSTFDLMSQ